MVVEVHGPVLLTRHKPAATEKNKKNIKRKVEPAGRGLIPGYHQVYQPLSCNIQCLTVPYTVGYTEHCGVEFTIKIRVCSLDLRPTVRQMFSHFLHSPTQPPVQWVPGLFRGKLRQGRDADPSPHSSAEVKNRVE